MDRASKSGAEQSRGIFFLLVTCSQIVPGTLRPNVIIRGTTMGPNFLRNEAELASLCPFSHPWSYGDGLKCCSTSKSEFFNRDIDFYDTPNVCPSQLSIPCPNPERKCRSNIQPTECPLSHAQAVQNGCCASQGAVFEPKLYPECFDLLQDHSPRHCCKTTHFLGVEECLIERRKCVSSGKKVPLESVILDEMSRPSYPAKNALKDSICDDLAESLWAGPSYDEGWFIFDLQYHKRIHRVLVRNAHNGHYHDRSTQNYSVLVSNVSDPFDWIEIVSGSLDKPVSGSSCAVPLVKTSLPGNGIIARYAKFHAQTYYGYGPVLTYVGFD